MAAPNNTDSNVFLPPDQQIQKNKELSVAVPETPQEKPDNNRYADVPMPVPAKSDQEYLPPDKQIAANTAEIQSKAQETEKPSEDSIASSIAQYNPKTPDAFTKSYIDSLDNGKAIYEAHQANPKIKWGIKQSMAMQDYIDSPESADPHPYVKAAKGLGELLVNGLKGVREVASDVFSPDFSILGDIGTAGDVIAGVPLQLFQIAQKVQQGGTAFTDDLGIGIDPNSGILTISPKTKTEKLINMMTRNDIDADRAIVHSIAPSNIGKLLYYAGEEPTDEGQQSYAQLLRPLLASYLVPSVKHRMVENPSMTEGQATEEWLKDSASWGTHTLQKAAAAIPAEKENVATAAELLIPEATTFGIAAKGLSLLGKGAAEVARLGELEALMPKAQAMTDVAETAKEGGTFFVDPQGNVTTAPKTKAGPRTKEQVREDWNNAEQLHADNLDKIESDAFERTGKTFRLGNWNVSKPYVWAGAISDKANFAADKLKELATQGAMATALPIATGAVGAYKGRDQGLAGIGGGFLKGVELGAAGELAGYTALKTAGKTAGVFSDIGKAAAELGEAGGNAFAMAGKVPTSSKATQDLFGGKIGKITAPTANWLANNMSQWAYQGVEAGALAAAMGVMDSTPNAELPASIASGAAMVLVPHILTSAIHESPAAREKRLHQENAGISYTKAQSSPDSVRTASQFRDYRNVVASNKQNLADKVEEYRRIIANPKAKPEEVNTAQKAVQDADQRLTQVMTANTQTRREFGRQVDLMWANIHRGLNGPSRAGQSNIGVEILTKDQILQKLVNANKDYASTPQGMAHLEHIATQDGAVINSAGGVELPAGTDLAEALSKTPILFDPSKTTAIVNADGMNARMQSLGEGATEALAHEGGHLYSRTEEYKKANEKLLNELFSKNVYDQDGNVASEEAGHFSNQDLKDMLWNNYLKGRTDDKKKAWLASKGMWDLQNDKFIDRVAIPYAREEVIADMSANALNSRIDNASQGYLLKWARINSANNILARTIQSTLGVGGNDPMKPSTVMGAEFSPEIIAANEKAMRAVDDYYGHIAPIIDSAPATVITQKDMMKSKGLLKKYGINSGMFQTQVFGVVRDAQGKIVARVPVNQTSGDGSWVLGEDGKPKQTKGYAQIPDEIRDIPIPVGGSLDVTREVALQPDGQTPILLSDSQQRTNQKARRNAILNAIGITEVPENGITWRGTLTPEQVQNIKALPEHIVPNTIKDVILKMNASLAEGNGQRWIIDYSPTSGKKGKRKSLTMKPYDVVPIGIHFTKDGNFNVTSISVSRLFNKLHAWGAEFPHVLDMWGGSKTDFFHEFATKYLDNWQKGKNGEEGLDPDPKIALMKRDVFNNFLNLKDKDTELKNLNRFYLKGKKEDLGAEGRDRTIMSIRADHVSSIEESNAQPLPVDYWKAKINAMPESGLPHEERPEEEPVVEQAKPEERKPSNVYYHGTTRPEGEEGKLNSLGLVFVSPDKEEASMYSKAKGGRVLETNITGKKIFDAENPEDLKEIGATDEDRLWDSRYIENEDWIKKIKDAGYDGFHVQDVSVGGLYGITRGAKNVALFETPQFTPTKEERKPSAIDLGITAAHSREAKPFGAQYVAPTSQKERITEATYTNPKTGEIAKGSNHQEANSNAPQEATDRESPAYGFATDKGRIVDRNEAYKIAKDAGQLKEPTSEEEKFHDDRGVLHSGMYEPNGISFMPSQLDEEYAKSLRFDANPETVQKLVDEAAEKAGYDSSRYWYHGTAGDRFNVPKGKRGVAAHISLNKDEAWNFAESAPSSSSRGEAKPDVRTWYLKKGELFDPTNEDHLKKVSKLIEPVREKIKNQPLSGQWALKEDTYNPETWKDKIWDFFEDSEIQKFIKDAGFIGYMDRESPRTSWENTENAAVFDPNSLKEAARVTHDDQNNVIPLSQRFDTSKPDIRFMPAAKLDSDHAKAIESGDTEKAQGLVDEAAKKAGYGIKAYHGSPNGDFQKFEDNGRGFFFTNKEFVAKGYTYKRGLWLSESPTGKVINTHLKMENPLEIDAMGSRYNNIRFPGIEWKQTVFGNLPKDAVSVSDAALKAFEMGHDGLIVKNVMDAVDHDDKTRSTVYVVKDSSQIKSADPATYDDQGNLIPLSQRFDTSNQDIRFMPKSEELPKTEDGKVDWAGFKAKTQEAAKPLAGLSFMPAGKTKQEDIEMKPSDDGRTIVYNHDPKTTIKPPVKPSKTLKGEIVGMLEADRHNTLGDNMGGPMHPFLLSNQVIARLKDGRGFKPVWANMNSAFVTRAKNIIKNTTSGGALIQLMKEEAHISNRKFVNDVMSELDKTKDKLSKEVADSLHVVLELGARNPATKLAEVTKAQKAFKDGEINQRELNKVLKDNKEAIDKYGPMVEFLAKLGSIKSKATRGNIESFNKAYSDHIKAFNKQAWYKKIADKYKDTKFADEAARFTFNQRGAAMKRLRGIAHAPDIGKMLADSMDFKGGKNLDLVASVQLSKDPDAFAIYTGNDPKQESKMSKNERHLRDQFMKDPNFRKHPSYDWMMLGPENADNFILEKPVDPLVLFPDYAKNHPKASVRNGSIETIVGTMKKSKIPLQIK